MARAETGTKEGWPTGPPLCNVPTIRSRPFLDITRSYDEKPHRRPGPYPPQTVDALDSDNVLLRLWRLFRSLYRSNIVFGLLYTAIMAITLPGAAPFYITLAVIEMALTAAIVIAAWAWATTEGGPE